LAQKHSLQRAFSVLEIKSFEEGPDGERIITGIASTPTPDRTDDIVEPRGAEFTLPIPLLWQHRHTEPIGEVFAAKVTSAGIEIKATIVRVLEAGTLKDRLDEAWQSIKHKLVRGFSIGFRPMDAQPIPGTFGFHIKKWRWHELSVVTIPANVEATIQTVKSLYATDTAASGTGRRPVSLTTAGVTATGTGKKHMAKTIAEQIAAFEQTRTDKANRMTEMMQKSVDEGLTLDDKQQEEYDELETAVSDLDKHIERLKKLDAINKTKATPAAGSSTQEGTQSRGGAVRVIDNVEPGLGFARMVKVKAVARLDHRYALDVAREMYPHDQRLHGHFEKANVAAGNTLSAVNAAALVDPQNLAGEFIEYLRPATIIGKFGTNGIPSLRRVPFNIRVIGQTTGGTGYWVGEGKPKPLTNFEYSASTLAYTKVAAISVITQELARFSTPSADNLTREGLRAALIERLDVDFIDPAQAAVANVNPASITNGLTALSPSGTSADAARADLANLLASFIEQNQDPAGLVLVMPSTLALSLSLMRNSLGQREFEGLTMRGGTLEGIPVIVSQYAANTSGAGNLVVAVNTNEVFLADDGEVTIDASTEASLQMLDNPTNDSVTPTATTMVSMYQTNSIALRAERFINWSKRRAEAVVYMDDVNWGSIGSPS
jgi:HK97 family phage major capsid protein/HK97 family phage prohead protease